ncbi:DUF1906 domain-containing protein [Paenibacillus pedocola]|uniref:DUF1906 domain-containing protein n=1 Tax=Paenibacillus pedocola TaxID=3242193 RepID=UPI002877952A|nr:DUF1906 domain-containing protein [Paenibacillus typhae]
MASKGIDCATPLTAEAARVLAASGHKFAARYLVPERLTWKRLTRTEAERITDAGMHIVSVFETTPNRPAGGTAAGTVDGKEAYQEALKIAQPGGSAIYFAVDYDSGSGDYDKIESYLKAAAAEIPGYAIGVYGSYAVIEAMAKRGAGRHFWQTYAWSGGKKSVKADLYQYKNNTRVDGTAVALDLNESYGNEGWWNTAIPALKPSEEEMVIERDIHKVSTWAAEAWEEMQINGYFDGTRPGSGITREEAAIAVSRLRRNLLKLIADNETNIKSFEQRLQTIEKEDE